MPSTDGTARPVSSSSRRECWSCRAERSSPTDRPPCTRTHREHWPAPEPTSSTSLPVDVTEHPGLVLGESLGPPDEAGVAEEAAVRRLVLVGVAVPVGPVGPPRLGLVDRAALDPDALRQVVLHGATLLASAHPCGCDSVGRVDFSDLTPLAGGWSGQTFLAEAGGERSVVRIYRPGLRDDAAPGDRRRGAASGARAGAGARRPGGTPRGRRRGPARSAGHVVPCRGAWRPPPADARRRARWPCSARGSGSWPPTSPACRLSVRGCSSTPTCASAPSAAPTGCRASSTTTRRRSGLGRQRCWTGCGGSPRTAQDLLDTVGRTCLVHSDLNPKNLLVDPDTLAVTGVLDWEFAHSGHPVTDLGNLLRFDRAPGVRRGRARPRGASAGAAPRRRRWTWLGRPTCGPWSTSRPARGTTRSRTGLTRTCRPSPGRQICTRSRRRAAGSAASASSAKDAVVDEEVAGG